MNILATNTLPTNWSLLILPTDWSWWVLPTDWSWWVLPTTSIFHGLNFRR